MLLLLLLHCLRYPFELPKELDYSDIQYYEYSDPIYISIDERCSVFHNDGLIIKRLVLYNQVLEIYNENVLYYGKNEVYFLNKLNKISATHFVIFKGWKETLRYFFIALEVCLRNSKELMTKHPIQFIVQVVKGIDLMHRNKVYHMDIKPSNVLYCKHPIKKHKRVFKLADFDSSTIELIDDKCTGSMPYMAPELYSLCFESPINGKTSYNSRLLDMFSLGAMFGRLFTTISNKAEIYPCYHPDSIQTIALKPNLPMILSQLDFVSTVQKLTHCDPLQRLAMEDLLTLSLFNQFN